MAGVLLAIASAVISICGGLLVIGAAMTYEEQRRSVDLNAALILLLIALVFAFGSGWAARGGV